MSYHTGTSYDNRVGEEVQELIDEGYQEILVAFDPTGGWNITGDKKKFWSWLLTPKEVEELQAENKRIRDLAVQIQEKYNTYVESKDCIVEENFHQINLLVRKLLR